MYVQHGFGRAACGEREDQVLKQDFEIFALEGSDVFQLSSILPCAKAGKTQAVDLFSEMSLLTHGKLCCGPLLLLSHRKHGNAFADAEVPVV